MMGRVGRCSSVGYGMNISYCEKTKSAVRRPYRTRRRCAGESCGWTTTGTAGSRQRSGGPGRPKAQGASEADSEVQRFRVYMVVG